MLAAASPLASERLALAACCGRALAEPLRSEAMLPAFDSSAMDGYALRALDVSGRRVSTPSRFRSPTRSRPGPRRRGPWPGGRRPHLHGRDHSAGRGRGDHAGGDRPDKRPKSQIARTLRVGENVRPAGEDLRPGEVALPAGCALGPAELGLAAALGRSELHVGRAARVAIVTTGDELREPGEPLSAAGIYDSNGPAHRGGGT